MGGQGKRVRMALVTPARLSGKFRRDVPLLAPERWFRAAHRLELSLASHETPIHDAQLRASWPVVELRSTVIGDELQFRRARRRVGCRA
jgi:hypothetical protein